MMLLEETTAMGSASPILAINTTVITNKVVATMNFNIST
jgi:hypothetical protein